MECVIETLCKKTTELGDKDKCFINTKNVNYWLHMPTEVIRTVISQSACVKGSLLKFMQKHFTTKNSDTDI